MPILGSPWSCDSVQLSRCRTRWFWLPATCRRPPSFDAARREAGIDARGTQPRRDSAADLVSGHAIDDYGLSRRKLPAPQANERGIAPTGTGYEFLRVFECTSTTYIEKKRVADVLGCVEFSRTA